MQALEWIGKDVLIWETTGEERIMIDNITWLQCQDCWLFDC